MLYEVITIQKVVFGLRLTAVQLSDGSCGTASTVDEENPHTNKKDRDFGGFSPSKYSGRSVAELFSTEKKSGLIDTVITSYSIHYTKLYEVLCRL